MRTFGPPFLAVSLLAGGCCTRWEQSGGTRYNAGTVNSMNFYKCVERGRKSKTPAGPPRTMSCPAGQTCADMSCPEGGCTQSCPKGATCKVYCEGGRCDQSCEGTCKLTCAGGRCDQHCAAGSVCETNCYGKRCNAE